VKIAGTNSHLLARAYGAPAPLPRPAAATSPAPGSIESRASRVADTASVGALRSPDVAARLQTPQAAAAQLERLVAATVPGRVDFDAQGASLSAAGSYTMHGRPADRNAAALAVQAGRTLDVQG